jgi:hypothetical protein
MSTFSLEELDDITKEYAAQEAAKLKIAQISEEFPGGTDISTDTKIKFMSYFEMIRVQLTATQKALDQLDGIVLTGISK